MPGLANPAEVHNLARIIERILRTRAAEENNLALVALDHVLAHKGQLDRMHHEHEEIDSRLKQAQDTTTPADARRLLKAAT